MTRKSQGDSRKRKRDARRRTVRLRVEHTPALGRYIRFIARQTHFLRVILLLVALWLLFAAGFFLAERGASGGTIHTYGQALYWGIAALSTAGIADAPSTGLGQAIGGTWIIIGSIIFFGTIVASITGYFMRPTQGPVRQIIDTIEYNLEQLDELSVEELELLKKTTDGLIVHMERLKNREKTRPT